MVDEKLVPWRQPGDACPVCHDVSCRPEHHYTLSDVREFAELGRLRKPVLENLYQGDVQPKSHSRLEITRATGFVRTVYYRKGAWHCVECSGRKSHKKPCEDIATGLTWLGIILPPQGIQKADPLIRNQAAWDQMADNWAVDYVPEVKRLVEATRKYMPAEWFDARTDPVDRIVALLALTDSGKPLRYAGGFIRELCRKGFIEKPFSYGTVHATKSLPGMKDYLDNLRRTGTAAFAQLAKSFGTDATGMPGSCKALYNKERAATRKHEDARQQLSDDTQIAGKSKGSKDAKLDVEDKPYNMLQLGFIRETRMIAELGFFQKNLKDIVREGVHVGDNGKIIIRGEQPWVWPMLFNAWLLNPGITEYHGDKGEFSEKLFLAGEKIGVAIDVPHKSNFKAAPSGGRFDTPKAAATRKLLKDLEDPAAFLNRYYQREADEGCIGGIKKEIRPWLRSVSPEHQEIEAQLMALKWNIKWALYEKYNQHLVPDYRITAASVFGRPPPKLEDLALRYSGTDGWHKMLRDIEALRSRPLSPAT